MERSKPQAAKKLVSQAGKNVSRKSSEPAQLKAFSFQNYQYNGQYIALLLTPMSKLYCAEKSTANSVITIFDVGFDIIMR